MGLGLPGTANAGLSPSQSAVLGHVTDFAYPHRARRGKEPLDDQLRCS
jgi:hypothetical protein